MRLEYLGGLEVLPRLEARPLVSEPSHEGVDIDIEACEQRRIDGGVGHVYPFGVEGTLQSFEEGPLSVR